MTPRSLFGATLVIAGTTIGAGMLALPLAGGHLGIITSAVLLIFLWYLMYHAGTITAALNVAVGKPQSLASIATSLGQSWISPLCTLIILGLFNALLAAYSTGATCLIVSLLEEAGKENYIISHTTIAIFYTVVLGSIISMSMQWVDLSNRIFFCVKILVFITVLGVLIPKIPTNNLVEQWGWVVNGEKGGGLTWSNLMVAIPAFLTSFGFHGSIPSVMSYLDNDFTKTKSSFFRGSLIALIVYLIWLMTCMGIMGSSIHLAIDQAQGDLGGFITILAHQCSNPWLQTLISIFSLLAILTSYLGVGIGLLDYWKEVLYSFFSKKSKVQPIFLAPLLTFIPSLCFCLFYPKGFMVALTYAAIALGLLAIIIPCWLALHLLNQIRTQDNRTLLSVDQKNTPVISLKIFGGRLGLWITLGLGIVIIVVEILHLSLGE